jgi:hypothetical protein
MYRNQKKKKAQEKDEDRSLVKKRDTEDDDDDDQKEISPNNSIKIIKNVLKLDKNFSSKSENTSNNSIENNTRKLKLIFLQKFKIVKNNNKQISISEFSIMSYELNLKE